MATNFLSALLQPAQPAIRSSLPDWLNPNMPILPTSGSMSAGPQRPELPDFLNQGSQIIPDNILQSLEAPINVPVAAQPAQSAEAPRPRRSFLDTVGRISDVLAKVGGAEALYQPTLDARQDREIALGDHARQVDLEALRKTLVEQQIAAGGVEATAQENAMLGQAVRGLQAIAARGGDINRAWPILARQAGIPDDRAAALGQVFAENPEALNGFASMLNAQKEFGLQPFYAQDAAGNLQAFQLGKDGTLQPITLPEGTSPIDPLKFVDVGNAQVGVGTRTGSPVRILPKGERPGFRGGQPINERPGFRGGRPIAPPPEKAGAGSKNDTSGMIETAQGNLNELRQIYADLNKMGAMVTPGQSSGANIAARVRASGAGQLVEGAIGTEAQTLRDRVNSIRPSLMQSIAKATGMTGKQLDSNADVKLFMQTVTNPASSFEANIKAIEGLERFLKVNAKRPNSAPAAPRRQKPAPRRGGGKPTVSNW